MLQREAASGLCLRGRGCAAGSEMAPKDECGSCRCWSRDQRRGNKKAECPPETPGRAVVLKRDALLIPARGQGTSRAPGSCIYCCYLLSPWQPLQCEFSVSLAERIPGRFLIMCFFVNQGGRGGKEATG